MMRRHPADVALKCCESYRRGGDDFLNASTSPCCSIARNTRTVARLVRVRR